MFFSTNYSTANNVDSSVSLYVFRFVFFIFIIFQITFKMLTLRQEYKGNLIAKSHCIFLRYIFRPLASNKYTCYSFVNWKYYHECLLDTYINLDLIGYLYFKLLVETEHKGKDAPTLLTTIYLLREIFFKLLTMYIRSAISGC